MPTAVLESRGLVEAPRPADGRARFLAHLITPGQGSSAFYTPEVLQQAARDRIWPAGTQCFIDHQTGDEWEARPVGSLKDLAAVTTEDARWDEDLQALVAETRVYSRWAPFLAEAAGDIGMSIRAWAEHEIRDVDGQPQRFATRFTEGISVDFVTRAGRGGRYEVLEHGGLVREARNVGQWVESRIHLGFTQIADQMFGEGRLTRAERITLSSGIGAALDAFVSHVEAEAPQLYQRDVWADPPEDVAVGESAQVAEAPASDRREQLTALVRDAYGAEKTWVYVRDFDDTARTVWFEVSTTDDESTWQQSYEVSDDVATALTGDRVEVRQKTVFVPVESATPPVVESAPAPTETPVDPAGPTETPATESEEDTMPQIEEARLKALEEASLRVDDLQKERDTLTQANESKTRRIAELEAREDARSFARDRLRESDATLAAATVNRIVEQVASRPPLTDDLRLDRVTLAEAVDKARQDETAYLAARDEEAGVGSVRGVGVTSDAATAPTPDEEAAAFAAFGVKG